MTAFVDTSALFALLDADDSRHDLATRAFGQLVQDEELVTHNYVAIEAVALAQRRLGAEAVRTLIGELLPVIATIFVDEAAHESSLAALMTPLSTRLSIVDLVSFQVMRERSISRAFAFDADFEKAGFRTIP